MTKRNEKILSTFQLKKNILKIVSNPKKGVVKVYNEKGKLLIKKTNLTKEQVKSIEESLMGHITKKLNDYKSNKKQFDPMIA